MRIGITGCTGLVGSKITRKLLELGHEVHGLSFQQKCGISSPLHQCKQLNLLDPDLVVFPFPRELDCLIHTAWSVESGEFWNAEKNYAWASQSYKLISNTVARSSTLVVVLGSCAEYEWPTRGKISESNVLNPKSIYGQTKKLLFDDLTKSGIKLLWPRIFFMYGEIEMGGKFLSYLHDSFKNNERPKITNPDTIIDYVSVHDVAAAICELVENQCVGEFNIGTGVGTSNREIAVLMQQVMESEIQPIFNEEDQNVVSIVADTNKISKFVLISEFRSVYNEINALYRKS